MSSMKNNNIVYSLRKKPCHKHGIQWRMRIEPIVDDVYLISLSRTLYPQLKRRRNKPIKNRFPVFLPRLFTFPQQRYNQQKILAKYDTIEGISEDVSIRPTLTYLVKLRLFYLIFDSRHLMSSCIRMKRSSYKVQEETRRDGEGVIGKQRDKRP